MSYQDICDELKRAQNAEAFKSAWEKYLDFPDHRSEESASELSTLTIFPPRDLGALYFKEGSYHIQLQFRQEVKIKGKVNFIISQKDLIIGQISGDGCLNIIQKEDHININELKILNSCESVTISLNSLWVHHLELRNVQIDSFQTVFVRHTFILTRGKINTNYIQVSCKAGCKINLNQIGAGRSCWFLLDLMSENEIDRDQINTNKKNEPLQLDIKQITDDVQIILSPTQSQNKKDAVIERLECVAVNNLTVNRCKFIGSVHFKKCGIQLYQHNFTDKLDGKQGEVHFFECSFNEQQPLQGNFPTYDFREDRGDNVTFTACNMENISMVGADLYNSTKVIAPRWKKPSKIIKENGVNWRFKPIPIKEVEYSKLLKNQFIVALVAVLLPIVSIYLDWATNIKLFDAAWYFSWCFGFMVTMFPLGSYNMLQEHQKIKEKQLKLKANTENYKRELFIFYLFVWFILGGVFFTGFVSSMPLKLLFMTFLFFIMFQIHIAATMIIMYFDNKEEFKYMEDAELSIMQGTYTALKYKLTEQGHSHIAGDFHFWEMEFRHQILKKKYGRGAYFKIEYWMLLLYWWAADYGENYMRLAKMLVLSFPLTAYVITLIEFEGWKVAFDDWMGVLKELLFSIIPGNLSVKIEKTQQSGKTAQAICEKAQACCDPFSATCWSTGSQVLVVLQGMLAVLLLTLFVMAVNRQFKR